MRTTATFSVRTKVGQIGRHGDDDGDSVMMWPRLASGDERLRVHGVAVVITLTMNSAQSCAAAGRVDHVRSGCSSSLAVVIAMASGGPTRRRTAAAATPSAFQCLAEHAARGLDRGEQRIGLNACCTLADGLINCNSPTPWSRPTTPATVWPDGKPVTASPATARRSLTVDEVRRHTDRQCGCRSTPTAIAAITPHSDSLIWHLMRAVTRAPICL
jgi:hypothetical protein